MSPRAPAKKASRKSDAGKKTVSKKATATMKKAVNETASTTPGTSAKPTVAAGSAKGLRVRMYRVGFGDFFLVTVPTSAGDRHILIDCGVFSGTTGKGDIGSIVDAVEDLFTTTGGQLALVVMTHRHADHIAGFSRAARFKDFRASMVWMPYWEQFNDATDSAHGLQLDIDALALQLAMQFRGRPDLTAQDAFAQLQNATGLDFDAVAKGGKKSGGNAVALDLLKNQLGSNGKNVRYYAAGDTAELPPELEGLSAEILGPPPKDSKAFLALTDLKKNVGQYLDSTTTSEDGAKAIHPFRPQWFADLPRDYPENDRLGYPILYKDIAAAVDGAQPDMLAAAAAKIDSFLNNQSLVVLFTFADKKLLFVGDAQAGNWEHWLYTIDAPIKDPTKAGPLTDTSQQILRTIDFYKVGHHGSTNATPIAVVEALGHQHSANGFVAMCSTQPGVYGNPDPAKATEVPRDPLMEALGKECDLIRSDSFPITIPATPAPRSVPATAGVDLPRPKVGTLDKKDLYVEYTF